MPGSKSVACPKCGATLDRVGSGNSGDGKFYVEKYRCSKNIASSGKKPECDFKISSVGKSRSDVRSRIRRGMPVLAKRMKMKEAAVKQAKEAAKNKA
jgi:hypothetical protein